MNSDDYAIIKKGSIHLKGDDVQERISKLKKTIALIIEVYQPDYFILEDVNSKTTLKFIKFFQSY